MISKELFEAVTEEKYSDIHFKALLINYDSFYFKCIDFVIKNGYVFVNDTRGYSRIKKLSNDNLYKIWEDEEYKKQRLFDACQYILENKDK